MEEREYLQPILASYGVFRPLKTHYLFSVHLLATLALDIATIVLTILRPDEKFNCREYFFLIYAHVGLWALTLVRDFVLFGSQPAEKKRFFCHSKSTRTICMQLFKSQLTLSFNGF